MIEGVRSRSDIRPLGPLLLSRQQIGRLRYRRDGILTDAHDLFALYFIEDGETELIDDTASGCARPGDVLVLDLTRQWSIVSERGMRCYTLLIPRAFLLAALPDGVVFGAFPGSMGFGAVRHLLAGLLALDRDSLDERQADLAAGALRHLLAAAFVPISIGGGSARREASLLDRAIAHVDARLEAELDVASLCGALGCSRSALYRATVPVGGIAELIVRRRLAAVHRRLRDPGERRAIGQIAQAHGFTDPSMFSRRFKRTFGATAGRVRVAGTGHARTDGDEPFDPFRALIEAFANDD